MNIQRMNVPTRNCPVCGYEMDCATCMDGSDAQPHMGDFSICINCRAVLRFGYGLTLEKASIEDLAIFEEAIKNTQSSDK